MVVVAGGVDADDGARLGRLHEHTVAGRGDDPVAGALDYYAKQARAAFFEQDPDITRRVAALDRTIERETELERRRHWELLVAREKSRSLFRGHDREHDIGPGLDL